MKLSGIALRMGATSNARQRSRSQLIAALTARLQIKPLSKNWNHKLFTLIFRMRMMCIVRCMRHLTDVKLRRQYEHERLHYRHENAQHHQRNRHQPPRYSRHEVRHRLQHFLVSKQVSEKPDAERKGSNEITNQLDREDQ